jgi:hypothetical protein
MVFKIDNLSCLDAGKRVLKKFPLSFVFYNEDSDVYDVDGYFPKASSLKALDQVRIVANDGATFSEGYITELGGGVLKWQISNDEE